MEGLNQNNNPDIAKRIIEENRRRLLVGNPKKVEQNIQKIKIGNLNQNKGISLTPEQIAEAEMIVAELTEKSKNRFK